MPFTYSILYDADRKPIVLRSDRATVWPNGAGWADFLDWNAQQQPPLDYTTPTQATRALTGRILTFDGHLSIAPVVVSGSLSIVTGDWLATWNGGHDGGALVTALARGTSLTLTGGQSYPLTLSLDSNGTLVLRGSLLRDYTVSLNLFGR